MLKRIKKLLRFLEAPEVVAFLRWLRTPLDEQIHALEDLADMTAQIKRLVKENSYLEAAINRFRAAETNFRFHFHCAFCDREITEPVPPEMRMLASSGGQSFDGANCCARCLPRHPHAESKRQVRPVIPVDKLGLAF